MTSMATPIAQLPSNNGPVVSGGAEDDPLIQGVLQDMETKMSAPPPQQQRQQPSQGMGQQYATNVPINRYQPPRVGPATGLWNPELAQKAVIIAIVAFVLLNPALLQALFKAVPMLETYLGPYSMIVSVLLLVVVLYALMKFTKLV